VILLAIDTTGERGGIALVRGGTVVEEVALHCPEGFAHILFSEIDGLLKRHGLAIQDVDAFASASGPGSFTGVRIGLTAAKGLAEATGKKVTAVSNLRALAWYGGAERRAVVIDARRGEIYGAVYDAALSAIGDEVVMKLEPWLAEVERCAPDAHFITLGAQGAGIAIKDVLAPLVPGRAITEGPPSIAGAIGLIASRDLLQCAGVEAASADPASIDANYVRRSDAELLWKEPEARR
jgi:tRNA threonylcarbamoyladenosine biosynthesis protein TsaB